MMAGVITSTRIVIRTARGGSPVLTDGVVGDVASHGHVVLQHRHLRMKESLVNSTQESLVNSAAHERKILDISRGN